MIVRFVMAPIRVSNRRPWRKNHKVGRAPGFGRFTAVNRVSSDIELSGSVTTISVRRIPLPQWHSQGGRQITAWLKATQGIARCPAA
jgi:hypothetical protein